VVLSLKQLGFEKKEIEKVIKQVPKELVSTEDRLGWCLQNLGK
jgi:Holliday junction resolvasome RuvABC DNA-binding subunit